MKSFAHWNAFNPDAIKFALGQERNGKVGVNMYIDDASREIALVTPACVTHWPRVTGDGNFGTMWGPSEVGKAKFTLDLSDAPVCDAPNANFEQFAAILTAIDERLLSFVFDNQLKVLGRRNLSRDELRMLQIRSVKPRYDRCSGGLLGHTVQLSTLKFASDGAGGKIARKINVCDHTGKVRPTGIVQPGDVVAATMYANQVYNGVGGDKFGIQWSFEDVQVICQRASIPQKLDVPAFGSAQYDFAQAYVDEMPG
jgi:hypothetical protein